MPFTPSHIIAVLPFKKFVSLDIFLALCVGAVSPDFTLFFPISNYSFSHSIEGILGFSLPCGIILFLLLKHAGLQYAQYVYYKTLFSIPFPYKNPNSTHWYSIFLAVILGASTHVIWDSFTHVGGNGVSSFPILKAHLTISIIQLPVYKLLQFVSSILGLLVIGWYILKVTLITKRKHRVSIDYLSAILLGIFFILPIIAFAIIGVMVGLDLKNLIGYTIKKALASHIVLFIILSTLYKFKITYLST